MSGIILQLGPYAFQDFEVPSKITLGGEQRLVVHQLPGGRSVVDVLGRSDSEISFAGVLSGQDATLRARSLDGLRVAGASLPLSWDVFFYSVIIRSFEADYRNPWWIPFRIACTVLRDEAEAIAETIASIASDVLSDLGLATTYANGAGLDLSAMTSALSDPLATTRGTASYAGAQASIGVAQSSIGAGITSAETSLGAFGPSLFQPGIAVNGVTALNGASAAAYQLGSLRFSKSVYGPYGY